MEKLPASITWRELSAAAQSSGELNLVAGVWDCVALRVCVLLQEVAECDTKAKLGGAKTGVQVETRIRRDWECVDT